MKNKALNVTLLALVILCLSCKTSEEKNINEHRIAKANKGEILSISGARKISGIYPHLTSYAHARENGIYDFGNECGIGGLAVWNEKLYMINYAAHEPKGSEHKLYVIDEGKNMEIFQGSIGGTPAARMIHQESNQLLIGPYVIDSVGAIRVIPIKDMQGRLTAIARHLKDPENMVYYYDMEGMLYEVNVYTLKVNKLYHNPLPGWHGKGGYTSQGKLVLANNGEHKNEGNKDWKELETISLEKEDYNYYIFKHDLKAEWVRLVTTKTSRLTAAFHLTDSKLKSSITGNELFKALAGIDETIEVSHAKLYSNKTNYNLSVYAGDIDNGTFKTTKTYEFLKYDFSFVEGIKDSLSINALKNKKVGEEVGFYTEKTSDISEVKESNKEIWTEDAASIILHV